MDEIEKKLLDIFNYYNREYKPFKIEKVHNGHSHSPCRRRLIDNLTMKKLKGKIFNITKEKKEFHFFRDFSIMTGLFEYFHKVNISNQIIMSSSYNYDNTMEFVQQLVTPVVCLSSNEMDFKNYYRFFQEYFNNLHGELSERIDFWVEFFNLTQFKKRDSTIDEIMKKVILDQ
jgi:hypothetical protein